MKAVLDTNVLVSAFIFPGGKPEEVFRLALEARLEIVSSPSILAEFGRVLTDKFGWEPDRAEDAVAQVARIAEVIETTQHVEVIAADPSDDRILEAALASGADLIVSGDKHLLSLREWQEVRILAPAQLVAEFESS